VVEQRQHGLEREEHGGQVRVEDLLEHLIGRRAERRRARDAGVGEHDVQLAEGRAHGPRDLGQSVGRVDVGLDREHARPQLGGGRVELGAVAARDRHARALREHQARGGKADAAVAAADEGGLAFQFHGGSFPSG